MSIILLFCVFSKALLSQYQTLCTLYCQVLAMIQYDSREALQWRTTIQYHDFKHSRPSTTWTIHNQKQQRIYIAHSHHNALLRSYPMYTSTEAIPTKYLGWLSLLCIGKSSYRRKHSIYTGIKYDSASIYFTTSKIILSKTAGKTAF